VTLAAENRPTTRSTLPATTLTTEYEELHVHYNTSLQHMQNYANIRQEETAYTDLNVSHCEYQETIIYANQQ